MSQIKVSVIIPVYNTEKYLGKCLVSVLNQSLREIEIICINDCSTDNSDEIINLYQEGIELGNLECYGQLANYLYKNNLYNNPKYEEAFNIAMEGEALGVSKCEYVILKEKLKEYEESKIVTIEELIVLRKLSKLINKGIYEVINDLIKWYSERKPEDKLLYYQLLEDKIYYNLKE